MDDLRQLVTGEVSEDYMNVIRHDGPGNEFVPLAVEMLECIVHDLGKLRLSQKALAVSRIEKLFNLL